MTPGAVICMHAVMPPTAASAASLMRLASAALFTSRSSCSNGRSSSSLPGSGVAFLLSPADPPRNPLPLLPVEEGCCFEEGEDERAWLMVACRAGWRKLDVRSGSK